MAETKSTPKAPTQQVADAATDKEGDAKLEHPAGGVTTRSDALDAGAPMLQGDAREPIGPEDAFGPGPKRGDYRARQPDGAMHYQAVAVEDPKPGEPTTVLVAQNPLVEDIGEAPKLKGGVETS
jgi:hypothetical protein